VVPIGTCNKEQANEELEKNKKIKNFKKILFTAKL
tara:strand:- start:720 stop:824 length:105 start_codon:yes stop_codon:yes gene_type:complete